MDTQELKIWIQGMCAANDIDPNIVYAIIESESNWDSKATNPTTDCKGLMQISPATWSQVAQEIREEYSAGKRKLLIDGPYSPTDNVRVGIRLICKFLSKGYSLGYALDCYAMGEKAALERLASMEYPAPTVWSKNIMARANELWKESLQSVENPVGGELK